MKEREREAYRETDGQTGKGGGRGGLVDLVAINAIGLY